MSSHYYAHGKTVSKSEFKEAVKETVKKADAENKTFTVDGKKVCKPVFQATVAVSTLLKKDFVVSVKEPRKTF